MSYQNTQSFDNNDVEIEHVEIVNETTTPTYKRIINARNGKILLTTIGLCCVAALLIASTTTNAALKSVHLSSSTTQLSQHSSSHNNHHTTTDESTQGGQKTTQGRNDGHVERGNIIYVKTAP